RRCTRRRNAGAGHAGRAHGRGTGCARDARSARPRAAVACAGRERHCDAAVAAELRGGAANPCLERAAPDQAVGGQHAWSDGGWRTALAHFALVCSLARAGARRGVVRAAARLVPLVELRLESVSLHTRVGRTARWLSARCADPLWRRHRSLAAGSAGGDLHFLARALVARDRETDLRGDRKTSDGIRLARLG